MATSNKYDRQLRLWGENGQNELVNTCVILIHATAVGTETLKNVILPGIGSYIIIDSDSHDDTNDNQQQQDEKVKMNHSNFFLLADNQNHNLSSSISVSVTTTSCTRISRAQRSCEILQELNPDVDGRWIDTTTLTTTRSTNDDDDNDTTNNNNNTLYHYNYKELFQSILNTTANTTQSVVQQQQQQLHQPKKRIIVIGSDCEPNLMRHVGCICMEMNISYFVLYSYGLMGIMKLQIQPNLVPIMDSKQPKVVNIFDLRLYDPKFLLLHEYDNQVNANQYCKGDWDQLTNQIHGHIPYPMILLKAYKEWKKLLEEEQQQTKQEQQESGGSGGSSSEKDMDDDIVILPITYEEKQQFVSIIQKLKRHHENDELNFIEAQKYSYYMYSPPRHIDIKHIHSLQQTLKQYLEKQQEQQQQQQQQQNYGYDTLRKYYILLVALERFLLNHTIRVRNSNTIPTSSNSSSTSTSTVYYQPPLMGTLPDMTSTTKIYTELQEVYQTQACKDRMEFKLYIQEMMSTSTNNNDHYHEIVIRDDEIITFIQNVYHLDLFIYRSIEQEYKKLDQQEDSMIDDDDENEICNDLAMILMKDEDDDEDDANNITQSPLLWYLVFRACQLFVTDYQRYPGVAVVDDDDDDDENGSNALLYQQDVVPLQKYVNQVIQSYNLQENEIIKQTLLQLKDHTIVCTTNTTGDDDNDNDDAMIMNNDTAPKTETKVVAVSDYVVEMVRYGNVEIHPIASIIGGIASQEIVKIVTGQHVPINNTYVYNGIASKGEVYKF